jgi:hypothetical protein
MELEGIQSPHPPPPSASRFTVQWKKQSRKQLVEVTTNCKRVAIRVSRYICLFKPKKLRRFARNRLLEQERWREV